MMITLASVCLQTADQICQEQMQIIEHDVHDKQHHAAISNAGPHRKKHGPKSCCMAYVERAWSPANTSPVARDSAFTRKDQLLLGAGDNSNKLSLDVTLRHDMIGLAVALVASSMLAFGASEDALCGQYQTHTNWPYMINNNAWNLDNSGSICTYVCDTCSEISFYSLWTWASEPPRVHAYPNVELKSDRLPLQLQHLASLYVSASWSFAPASLPAGAAPYEPTTEPVASALTAADVQANVVLDVFADADQNKSQTPSRQTYELMVWVGVFGESAWPIGMNAPRNPPVVVSLDETEFTLYNGTNSRGQQVYSWVTNDILTTFSLDVAPLFGYLWEHEGIPGDVYLGIVQFGTETFYSESQMNFSVSSYEARIESTIPDASGTGSPRATLPVGTAVSAANATIVVFMVDGGVVRVALVVVVAFLVGVMLMA